MLGNWEDQAHAQSYTAILKRSEDKLHIHLSVSFKVPASIVKAKAEL